MSSIPFTVETITAIDYCCVLFCAFTNKATWESNFCLTFSLRFSALDVFFSSKCSKTHLFRLFSVSKCVENVFLLREFLFIMDFVFMFQIMPMETEERPLSLVRSRIDQFLHSGSSSIRSSSGSRSSSATGYDAPFAYQQHLPTGIMNQSVRPHRESSAFVPVLPSRSVPVSSKSRISPQPNNSWNFFSLIHFELISNFQMNIFYSPFEIVQYSFNHLISVVSTWNAWIIRATCKRRQQST